MVAANSIDFRFNFRSIVTYYVPNSRTFHQDFREAFKFGVASLIAEVCQFEADRTDPIGLHNLHTHDYSRISISWYENDRSA